MFEQDYLVRLLLQFFQGLLKSYERRNEKDDPQGAADLLEAAVGEATDMDGQALLTLAPESIASVMRVSGIDPDVTQFIARSLLLESVYLTDAGDARLAETRVGQARAIASEYGFELPDDPSDFESITEGLEAAALAGGFDRVSLEHGLNIAK